ncbi:hypothetical protein [Thomasclavelia sp.]
MYKETIAEKPDIFKEGKELEQSCLNDAINKIPWLQKFKLVSDNSQERPDFILEKNNKLIGIEHFHIDLLYADEKKHTGLSRFTYKDIRNLFNEYHVKAINNTFELKDVNNASKDLENILNELIDRNNTFDYNLFIKEWSRIFNKHYKNINEYKKVNNLYKLGFLIEIRRYFKFPYICYHNNSIIPVRSKSIPITKEIAKYLNKYDDGVDFFIIAVKGLLDDYASIQFYDKSNIAKAKYDYFELAKISGKFKINIDE